MFWQLGSWSASEIDEVLDKEVCNTEGSVASDTHVYINNICHFDLAFTCI